MDDKTKALAKMTPGPGLKLVQVNKPEVGHNDVLIRVRKTAICGTEDLPSITASAITLAYSWMARIASSLPGMT